MFLTVIHPFAENGFLREGVLDFLWLISQELPYKKNRKRFQFFQGEKALPTFKMVAESRVAQQDRSKALKY